MRLNIFFLLSLSKVILYIFRPILVLIYFTAYFFVHLIFLLLLLLPLLLLLLLLLLLRLLTLLLTGYNVSCYDSEFILQQRIL
jgi:hypothetical protein